MRIVLLLVLAVLTWTPNVLAVMHMLSGLELATQSDVVIHGRVVALNQAEATVEVHEVIDGTLDGRTVRVSPVTLLQCVSVTQNFGVGEEVLIFGKRGDDARVIVVGQGQGKVRIEPETRPREIAAARRLIQIDAMADEHARKLAMLDEARSDNPRLRRAAHVYISQHLSRSNLPDEYQDRLVALLFDAAADVQRAGLNGLRFARSAKALSRVIELSRSDDRSVVTDASLALGGYDTPESAAALIALTRHPDPDLRHRACVDLSNSRRPESKAALAALLDDPVTDVRAIAPRGLVFLLRAGSAEDLVPKLVAMLDDPEDPVRVRAADALGETRNRRAVAPLLAILQRPDASRDLQRVATGSLGRHYSNGLPESRAQIEQRVDVLINVLKRGEQNESFGPSFHAIGLLGQIRSSPATEAVEGAAGYHPSEEIREYAARIVSER